MIVHPNVRLKDRGKAWQFDLLLCGSGAGFAEIALRTVCLPFPVGALGGDDLPVDFLQMDFLRFGNAGYLAVVVNQRDLASDAEFAFNDLFNHARRIGILQQSDAVLGKRQKDLQFSVGQLVGVL